MHKFLLSKFQFTLTSHTHRFYLIWISDKINVNFKNKYLYNKDTKTWKNNPETNVSVMVFNVTFNNISAITWLSVLLVVETGMPGEIHKPVASLRRPLKIVRQTSRQKIKTNEQKQIHTINKRNKIVIILKKWKTKYTTLSEQFQNTIEKQNIPHCQNSSTIQ